MFRVLSASVLRASGLGALALGLTACTPGLPADPSKVAHLQVEQTEYDDYYGSPPPQTHQPQRQNDSTAPLVTPIEVNPKAPQSYTVKAGDTLWGIARMFLNTPWHWPEIWDKNQDIKNPHLIYPGDVLHFGYVNDPATHKLAPRIRVDSSGRIGQPLSTISPFLAWPRIMDDDSIRSAPYILESRDSQMLMTPNSTLYIKHLARNPQIGQRFAVYRPERPLHDPETGDMLGHQVSYTGYARLDRIDTISTGTLLEVDGVVRAGNRLLPVDSKTAELRAPIQIPRQRIRGQIAALYNAQSIGANHMVVVINRGKQHGIQPGYTLGVYRDGRSVRDVYRPNHQGRANNAPIVQLPPEKVANAIVYSVHDRLSYALIVDSEREVRNGDRIGNP